MIVRSRDLTADKEEVSAVPFISARRGFNCGKLTSIIREVLGVLDCSAHVRKVIETVKDAAINDNHLYRLRLEECAKEITGFFSATTDPAASARAFRLAIQDRITSRAITPPTKASDADYKAAAEWVNVQSPKQGTLKKAILEWLTHRNVELQWWRLQAVCRPIFGQPATIHTDGHQLHMIDMVFLKYVVPIMQTTGPLQHSVEQWMDVMCAVDMLQNGTLSVDQTGEVDLYDDGVMKAVWQGRLPSNGRHPNQRADSGPAAAAPQLEDENGELKLGNAATDIVRIVDDDFVFNTAPAVAAVVARVATAVRRKCSQCGSFEHQSNNRSCPGNIAISDDAI